ncbi:MAG TPA: hypothetical protein VM029_13720, partial [Opitutaceae bacterium]|nr:hypothetical protein [Opitutaceae bacterium]
ERRSDLFAGGFNYMVDREKMTALEKEQHDAIARLLSPSELLEYDLRTSSTAMSMREEFSAFHPTEEEFRAIYQIRAPFDQRFNNDMGGLVMNQEQQRQRAEAERLVKEQIKAALGPVRADEYERMTDYNYRRTSQLIARLEMAPETADRLFAVQKEFEQRRSEVYRAGMGSREQMVEKMTALQQEALARVTPILRSATAVEAYKLYGGNWITSLVPRPTPPRK